jgi:putative solute:sodium symporter small subunit
VAAVGAVDATGMSALGADCPQINAAQQISVVGRGKNMELSEKHREYWHRNLLITAILLFIWFVVTFVEGWYARELNAFTIFGFPFGFYMSAQGSLIVYVVLIWIYARYMNKLDIEYGVQEGEDE